MKYPQSTRCDFPTGHVHKVPGTISQDREFQFKFGPTERSRWTEIQSIKC